MLATRLARRRVLPPRARRPRLHSRLTGLAPTLQSVFADGLPTPSRCDNEDALARVTTALEQRLAQEKERLAAAHRQQGEAGEGTYQVRAARQH